MHWFRNRPIREKLIIIVMMTSTSALLLAGVGVSISDAILFRGYLERDLAALAEIVADNSTAALAFNDPRVAGETLAALRARPHMVTACIYRLDGTTLARYSRAGASDVCPTADGPRELDFGGSDVRVAHPILLSGRPIGTLALLYDLGELSERRRLYGAAVTGVLLVSLLLGFLLSARLRAAFVAPISELVRVTTAVAATSDYGLRAPRLSGDEFGVLVDGFNEMLTGIQSRDATLTKALRDREEALRDAEKARERFHFMAESMPQKIFTATPLGDVDYFNRQWTEFTGLSFEQIKDWGWTQFVHPDDVAENVRVWRESIKTGEVFHFQHRFRRAVKRSGQIVFFLRPVQLGQIVQGHGNSRMAWTQCLLENGQ